LRTYTGLASQNRGEFEVKRNNWRATARTQQIGATQHLRVHNGECHLTFDGAQLEFGQRRIQIRLSWQRVNISKRVATMATTQDPSMVRTVHAFGIIVAAQN
jgi:hypothetical protein